MNAAAANSSNALDLEWVRSQFPAFEQRENEGQAFFENAGGSFACRQTIDAMHAYYTETKVQPYAGYSTSARAGEQMDRSRDRWAQALGVTPNDVQFGPSTSMNTYVLSQAFADVLGPGDEVVVTNQDHEANTGVFRRMTEAAGATLVQWRTDQATGLLDPTSLDEVLSERTKLITFPHCSNIVGQENNVAAITAKAHDVGARVVVDAVSYAPHGLVDVGALGCDVYLFSLYKVYSVHQGLMVTRNGILDHLPNQGHHFNADKPNKRLTPAGPDHAQEAAAGAVLDYVEAFHRHHGGNETDSLRDAAAAVTAQWQNHESLLLQPVLEHLAQQSKVRLLGPSSVDAAQGHRCPTVAFVPLEESPVDVARALVDRGIQASAGDFYAGRVLEGMDVDPNRGVVRVSWVHYTSHSDIDKLLTALQDVL